MTTNTDEVILLAAKAFGEDFQFMPNEPFLAFADLLTAEKDAEIADLQAANRKACDGRIEEQTKRVEMVAQSAKLREALVVAKPHVIATHSATGGQYQRDLDTVNEALSTPDPTAILAERDQRAAGELPDLFELQINVERGAGVVYLVTDCGDQRHIDFDEYLSSAISDAIDVARNAGQEGEAK